MTAEDDDDCPGCICGAIRMAPCSHCENHYADDGETTCGDVVEDDTPPPRRRSPLGAVYKDDGVWEWTCRWCRRSDWRVRWADALAELLQHLHRHSTFGFRSKEKR